jgi:hypothetical protein
METSECAEKVNTLWLALAEQIAIVIPDIIISNHSYPVDTQRG